MKRAMIWGATGGIGRALTKKLVDRGWQTLVFGRKISDLGDLTPLAFEADLSQSRSVEQAVYSAAQEVEKVDLWIYAAGDITSEKVADLSPQDWERILTANLSGAYLAIHHSLPLLAEDAQLIFLGAISERLQLPGLSAYAAAKAGLEAFVETLRKEERNRRVTLIRPVAVTTALWEKVPMRPPPGAITPEALADRVLQAYEEGQTGRLDVSH